MLPVSILSFSVQGRLHTINPMQKIKHSIFINAPKEKVWDAMLEDATYREWTKPFNEGSYYEGSWEEGATIKFLGVDENGEAQQGGMYSRIKENSLHEFVSIEHLGFIGLDGTIDTESAEVKKWTPAFENYTFIAIDGGTNVDIEVDSPEEYSEMFDEQWPPALQLLKEIAETK